MIGRITFKRAIKQTAGRAAVLAKLFTWPSVCPKACILVYHRIADVGFVDPRLDDWNVPPSVFDQQIRALAAFAEFLPLLELPHRLRISAPSAKPLVCLTFDDGYANFYTQALPILNRYRAPATAFVVTSLIGQKEPLPFDSWSQKNRSRVPPEAWRSMDWTDLEACVASGLVSIGAHSHSHLKGRECTQTQLIEEAEESRAILRSRLGEAQARAYAYPYGSTRLGQVSPDYAKTVRTAGYELAVTTDLGLARADTDPYLLPRIEAHALDTPSVLHAKTVGALAPYYLTDHLRTVKRAL